MSHYHTTCNWLGEPVRVRLESEPDTEYERLRDEIEIQDALDAQLKLFPRSERSERMEGVA